MPELPEVETIKRQLETKIVGQTIGDIKIIYPKSFQGDPQKIIGQKIISLTRIGKQLSFNLSNNYILLAHFKMTGGFFFQSSKHTRVILYLNSPFIQKESPQRGKGIYFNDLRKFGWLKLFTPQALQEFQKNLGLDILSPDFTEKYFFNQLQSSTRPIKILLLDQNKFAGIGNIYASDSLFLSQINPLIPAKNISLPKSTTLCHNLKKIMSESILHGGSTARDRGYLLPDGNAGTHQDYFLVYGRKNEKCLICKTKIKRIKQGGRSTFYCPHCQK
jgi:formamidopyrimidine-DNA glycosylase